MKKVLGMLAVLSMFTQPSYSQDMMSTSSVVTTTLLVSGLDTDSVNPKEKSVVHKAEHTENGMTAYQRQGPVGKFMVWVVTALSICCVLGLLWILIMAPVIS